MFYFFLQKWWKKFRESEKGQKFKGLDLKSVNLIGQMGKEKVQPESENLTSNMEQNEGKFLIFIIQTCPLIILFFLFLY